MKKLATGALGTGSGTLLYTVPNGYKTEVQDLNIANTTTSALTCTIHLVPTGSSPAAATQLFPAVSIPANTLIQWTGKQLLNAGDFIQGIGSASGLTVHISGEEMRVGA